jgi:hypothetical protein
LSTTIPLVPPVSGKDADGVAPAAKAVVMVYEITHPARLAAHAAGRPSASTLRKARSTAPFRNSVTGEHVVVAVARVVVIATGV